MSKVIWLLSTKLNSFQSYVFTSLPVFKIVPRGPLWGEPQKCQTREQSNGLMSTVHIFFSSSSTSKQEEEKKRKSVNFAAAIVLSFSQTSGWFFSSSDILYLPTISQYLSLSILLFGREDILFSTLIAWSLNGDCQQLGTWFSLFTDLSFLQWTES